MLKAILGFIFAGCILLAVIGVVIAVVGSSTTTHHSSSEQSTESKGSPTPSPDLSVSALKLSYDDHENEVQADNIYKNRWLDVSGVVTEIRKDFTDGIIVAIGPTQNEFEPVDAHLLDAEGAKAATLHKWQPIEIICKGDGMIVGSPQLSDCSIHEREVKQPTVTAEPAYQQPDSVAPPQTEAQPSNNSAAPVGSQTPAPIVREPPPVTQPQNQ